MRGLFAMRFFLVAGLDGGRSRRTTRALAPLRAGVALGTAALLLATLGVPENARADTAPLNAAAGYAINVPGSVLAEAATSRTTAALAASSQTYNWALAESQFATVSGASTASPAVPSTALTAAEQAQWKSLTARFAAPATEAEDITKVAVRGNVAMIGFQMGLLLGQGGARLLGFRDNQVCEQRNGALTLAASVLDGVDCSAFENAMTTAQRNLDYLPDSQFDPVTLQGVTFTYVGGAAVPPQGDGRDMFTCFRVSGPLPDGYHATVTAYGADDTLSGSDGGLMTCQNNPSTSSTNLTAGPIKSALTSWQAALWAYSGPTYRSATVVAKSVTQPNPTRHVRCILTASDGRTFTSVSDVAFTENDQTIPLGSCPAVPANTMIVYSQLDEVAADGSVTTLQHESTTSAYRGWVRDHPECGNGSCPTVLSKNGMSCFKTTDPDECDGWVTDPNRDSTYSCRIGTRTVPISDCFIYGQLFNTAKRDSGHAYADPTTGGTIDVQTSPTRTDRLTNALLDAHKSSWLTSSAGAKYPYGDAQTDSSRGATARAIAAQCVALGVTDEECENLPIFAPGSDIPAATQNDVQGLAKNVAWVRLNYADEAQRARDQWYIGIAPCVQGTYNTDAANPEDCDEYPYRSTLQGGPGAHIAPIPRAQNRLEGQYLGTFYSASGCNVGTATYANPDRAFLVLPTPTVHTSMWCNATQE